MTRTITLLLAVTSFTAIAADLPLAAPVTFKVDTTLSASVRQVDVNHLSVSLDNGRPAQTLEVAFDESGTQEQLSSSPAFFQAADFNFDGHQDLAWVTPAGAVDQQSQIFLYDPVHQQFSASALSLPVGDDNPQGHCGQFAAVDVNANDQTLTNACSADVWSTDSYRYTATGQLYVYQLQDTLPEHLQVLLAAVEEQGAVRQITTFDANGKRLSQQIRADKGGVARLRVPIARLTLHEKPEPDASRRYLIEHDVLEILDISDDEQWLKVQYRNAKKGLIGGWVAMADLAPEDSDDAP